MNLRLYKKGSHKSIKDFNSDQEVFDYLKEIDYTIKEDMTCLCQLEKYGYEVKRVLSK